MPPVAKGSATRTITLFAAASKAAGLMRSFVGARTLGTTAFADAYTAANAVPNVLVDVVANGVANGAVVPLQAAAIAREEHAEADRAISAQLSWLVVITVPLTVAAILGRNWIARAVLGSSHNDAQLAVASRMLIVLLLQIPLYGFGVVMSSALQARRLFVGPAIAPLMSSTVLTATYLIFAMVTKGRDIGTVSHGAESLLVIGTTLGVVTLTMPLAIPLMRWGFRFTPTLRLAIEHRRGLARLGAAGLFAVVAQQAATIITMRLASAEDGGVVIMSLTITVVLMPLSLVASPLTTTSLPELAGARAIGDFMTFERIRGRLLHRTSRLGLVAGVVVAAGAPALAWVLLRSSPGDQSNVGLLARAIAITAPAAFGVVICHVTSRICFALGEWRSAAVAAGGGWALAAIFEVIAIRIMSGFERTFVLSLCLTAGFMVSTTISLRLAASRRVTEHR